MWRQSPHDCLHTNSNCRVCHQQYSIDALRQVHALFIDSGGHLRLGQPPALAGSPRQHPQRIPSVVRPADAADGGNSAEAARVSTGGTEGEALRWPGGHCVQGGRPAAAAKQGAFSTQPRQVSCPHAGMVPLLCSPATAPTTIPSLQRRTISSSTVNVDLLKPFFEQSIAPQADGPVSYQGQEAQHEAELLLNHWRRYILVVEDALRPSQALPGLAAGAHVCRRRRPAGGGAGALQRLSRQGGRVRHNGPPVAVRVAVTLTAVFPP